MPPLGARNEERGLALSSVAWGHKRKRVSIVEEIDEKGRSDATKTNEQACQQEKLPERLENQPKEPPDAPYEGRLADLVGCNSPLAAWKGPDGVAFNPRDGWVDQPLELPCGRCMGCRVAKKQEWALRAMHEAQTAEGVTAFVTLTYSDEYLPEDMSLEVKDWQNFAKKLRKRVGPFRFLACGEYGDNLRPHFHALIYGVDFTEDRWCHQVRGQHKVYRSDLLEHCWPKGFSEIGDVSWSSAAYVANYVTKKMGGDLAEEHYRRVDPLTGETWSVRPEFAVMSRRPGLGKEWFSRYWRDVYPRDEVWMNGKRYRPPKYYDGLLQKMDEKLWRSTLAKRRDQVSERSYKERVANETIKRSRMELTSATL